MLLVSSLHTALAWLAAASTVALLAVAVSTAAGRFASYRLVDRVLLVQLATATLAAVTGGASLVSAGTPSDALHVLYGAVVGLAPIGARAAAGRGDVRRIGRWVTVAATVAIAATVRSFMTGS